MLYYTIKCDMKEEHEAALAYLFFNQVYFEDNEKNLEDIQCELVIKCGDIYISPTESYNMNSKEAINADEWSKDKVTQFKNEQAAYDYTIQLMETIEKFGLEIENLQ